MHQNASFSINNNYREGSDGLSPFPECRPPLSNWGDEPSPNPHTLALGTHRRLYIIIPWAFERHLLIVYSSDACGWSRKQTCGIRGGPGKGKTAKVSVVFIEIINPK